MFLLGVSVFVAGSSKWGEDMVFLWFPFKTLEKGVPLKPDTPCGLQENRKDSRSRFGAPIPIKSRDVHFEGGNWVVGIPFLMEPKRKGT